MHLDCQNKLVLSFFIITTVAGLSICAQTAIASIDPQAQQILARSVNAYQSLQSYQDTSVNVDDSPTGKDVVRQEISFKSPRYLNVRTTSATYQLLDNYDGVNYNYSDTSNTGTFWSRQPLPDSSYGRRILLQYRPAGLLFTPFLAGVNPLNPPYGIAIASLKMGPVVTLDKVKVDTVIATPLGDSKTKYTYLIGQKDHLLRRVIRESVTVLEDKYTTTETHSNIKTNLAFPEGTFKFHVPPEATLRNVLEGLRGDVLKKGEKAPYFHALDLANKNIDLNQYKGKVLLMDFWATWCLPCRYEMPYLQSLYQKYHSQGLEIVGVSQDHKRSTIQDFIHQFKVPWRQIHDSAFAISLNYKANGLPATILIDRSGKVVAVNQSSLLLDTAIRKALKQ